MSQSKRRFENMVCSKTRLGLAGLSILTSLALTAPAAGSGLLPNGDFEAGFLIGWLATERGDGITDIVTAGECFSEEDTTRLSLFGNHAAILRSGPSGSRGSVGILTSEPFIAGDGIMFAALTGTRDGYRIDQPVEFEARILTADGNPLSSQPFRTSVVRLQAGCPSEPRDGRFFVHYFDTRKFVDQDIRVQFRQNTNTGGLQPFTLIDRVIRFGKGKAPLFTSRPEAIASISRTRRGALRLDASRSFDPDGGPAPLTYRWQLDGENRVRLGEYHCLADLDEGIYTATLYVNDGFHVVSDSLIFELANDPTVVFPPANAGTSPGPSAEAGATVSIPGCETGFIETLVSVDSGVPGSGEAPTDDDADTGDETPGDDDQGSSNGTGPVLDLDADDSSGIAGSNYQSTFEAGEQPVAIADFDIFIGNAADNVIQSATIQIQNPAENDQLVVDVFGVPNGITFTVGVDSVKFSGSASPFDYGVAIGTVGFRNTAPDPPEGIRIISIAVSDPESGSNTAFAFITVD